MSKVEELKALLTDGPAADIFKAEQALAIFGAISDNAPAVNGSSFAPALGAYQSYAVEQFVLAITRLYDEPKKQYQLRSLPAVLEFVRANAVDLPIAEPTFFEQGLRFLGIFNTPSDKADEKTRQAMESIRGRLPHPDRNPALLALKALRDKRLAHPEHVNADDIPRTSWDPAKVLLDSPRHAVGVLGAYTSTAYLAGNGDYFMSYDAQVAAMAIRRMLRKLGLAPPNFS